jgi:5-(carboxyamino)imidazole ribonucleotide synthase
VTPLETGPLLVGVLGGGQLGRMLALAGIPMGLRFRFLEPGSDGPVRSVGQVVHGRWDDSEALRRFASGLDVVTYEFENVPVEAVAQISKWGPVLPPSRALARAQDRLAEKELFRRLGVQTAPFIPVGSRGELEGAARELGFPAVLKTCRMGYDGKGQRLLRGLEELESAWQALGDQPLILEGFVAFDRELSIIGVRGKDGAVAFYPVSVNEHRDGILRTTRAPSPEVPSHRQEAAERIAAGILHELDYVGVLAVELFDTPEGLLANEMAPRVHNSGHWTQDGAETSQFENHLRAILGLPLGSPAPRGWSAMVNLIGSLPDRSAILDVPCCHLHLYDKEPRAGRKLGHVNLVADTSEALEEALEEVLAIVGRGAAGREPQAAAQPSQSP